MKRILFALLVGVLAFAVWLAFRSAGSQAGTRPSLVAATLGAVQTPSAGEFPTIPSAIRYFIAQLRGQDLEAATRVMPVAYEYQRMTFAWQANYTQSVGLTSFFPKRPFSKLYQVLTMLNTNYTLFGVELLRPDVLAKGVIILRTPTAEQTIESALDPDKLAHISVLSVSVTGNTAKVGGAALIGVSRTAEAHVVIGGLPGRPRVADIMLDRYGTNWLVTYASVPS